MESDSQLYDLFMPTWLIKAEVSIVTRPKQLSLLLKLDESGRHTFRQFV